MPTAPVLSASAKVYTPGFIDYRCCIPRSHHLIAPDPPRPLAPVRFTDKIPPLTAPSPDTAD